MRSGRGKTECKDAGILSYVRTDAAETIRSRTAFAVLAVVSMFVGLVDGGVALTNLAEVPGGYTLWTIRRNISLGLVPPGTSRTDAIGTVLLGSVADVIIACLALYLVIGAVGLLKRNPEAVRRHVRWAKYRITAAMFVMIVWMWDGYIAASVSAITPGISIQTGKTTITGAAVEAHMMKAAVFSSAMWCTLSILYPITLLFLRRQTNRTQMSAGKTGKE